MSDKFKLDMPLHPGIRMATGQGKYLGGKLFLSAKLFGGETVEVMLH
jgi:hypothetical protein